jgi:serine/threonine protein kinase
LEPKVADFGLSKVVTQGTEMTVTVELGTGTYMAPEVFDREDYGFPVDVYSFGILVYVCITLMEPWPAVKNTFQLGRRVRQGLRPEIPVSVSRNWRDLICSCWTGVPEDRPTFEEISTAMGTEDFIEPGVDKAAVLAYQRRTVPERFHLLLS